MDKDEYQGIKRLYVRANLSILLMLALAISLLFLWSYRQAAEEQANELRQEVLRSKREFIQDAVNRTIQDIEQERAACANNHTEFCTEDAIKQRLRERIRVLRLKDNGYIWINAILNYEGGDNYAYRFVHPNLPDTEGMMLSTSMQDIKGNFPYRMELEGVKQDGEIFFDYWFKKLDSDEIGHKLTFAKLYKPYDWVVATGVYLDDVDVIVQSGMDRWRRKVGRDVVSALGLTSVALFLTWLLSIALGRQVDSMYAFFLNEVTSREDALRQHKEILEKQVGERTASLRASEEKLKESEERLRLTLEAAQIATFDWDLPNDLWWGSSVYYTMLGYEPKDEPANREEWLARVHPEDREYVNQKIQAVLNGRSNDYQYEARLQHANGTYQWMYVRGFGTRLDDKGKVTRMLGIKMDITERKQAEEEIHKLNKELEQRVADRTAQLEAANQELEAFAYSVSHDLRAPLRHIDGFIGMLRQRTSTSLDEQSQHYMENITDAAWRMSNLIEDLLAFSRMGRQELSRTPVDLNKLLQEILGDLTLEKRDRKIEWKISSLPFAMGDRAMLRMVLVNLISNALKFSRSRNVTQIEIGYETKDDAEIVIFVRDNGVGFDMSYADKLFGVFQRLHRAEEFEGTGIGLANVRRIINRHGGRVWAEGQVNQGATFYFSLPRYTKGG